MKPAEKAAAYLLYLKQASWQKAIARFRRLTREKLGNKLANPWSVPFIKDPHLIKLLDYEHFNLIAVKRAVDESNVTRIKTEYQAFKIKQDHSALHPLNQHTPDPETGRFTKLAEKAQQSFPEAFHRFLEKADQVLDGRFSFLGEEPVDLGTDPDLTTKNLDNLLWSHHLHSLEFLPLLAQAFHLTGDDRYLNGMIRLLGHWSDRFGYPEGPAWNPHTAAMRCSAFTTAYCLLLPVKNVSSQLHWQLALEISQHYLFIRKNIEHDLGYNHVISEMKALLQVRFAFPEWKLTPSLESLWDTFLDYTFKQVAPDGGHRERSLHYHLAVTIDLFELMLGAEKNDLPDLDEFSSLLEDMFRFLSAFTAPHGNLVPLGDGFTGFPMTAGEVCELGASRFDDKELAHLGKDSLNTLWLLGETDDNTRSRFEDRSLFYSFPQTGYWSVKTTTGESWELLTWDCGRSGPDDNPGHAHLDALSFHLETDRGPLFPDTGTFTYQEGAWRDYFRGTAAHNTARVDGNDQAALWKPFRLASRYKAKTDRVWQTPDYVVLAGTHDGYRRLKDPVDHHRTLIYFPQILLVSSDYFQARTAHSYELFYHSQLAGGFSSEDLGSCFPGTVFSDTSLEISSISGSDNPPRGWFSKGWMTSDPLSTHSFTTRETGPCCLVSVIWINPTDTSSSISRLDVIKNNQEGPALPCREAWALCLKRPGDIRHIFLRPEQYWQTTGERLPEVKFGGVETDAMFVLLRKNLSNRTLHFGGYQVSRIAESGLSFLETEKPVKQVNGYIRDETVDIRIKLLPGDKAEQQVTIFSPFGKNLLVNGKTHPFDRDGEFLRFSFNPAPDSDQPV
ncbi:MAG: alginate lyase family protein [bacterium]|nr:alginate lyase family protein [bacterium]